LAAPSNEDVDIQKDPTLEWADTEDAIAYDLYFGKDQSNLQPIGEALRDTEHPLQELERNTSYYWKVTATDVWGGVCASDLYAFTTDDTPFKGGKGTQAQPYQIETWHQLHSLRDYREEVFVLTTDLSSLTDDYTLYAAASANDGNGWLPIGDTEQPFSGMLSGDGYAIKDINCNREESDYNGLFGMIDNASVEELTIEAITVYGKAHTGSLAGRIENATITNVTSFGIDLEGNGFYTGGLCGYAKHSFIRNVTVQGDVSSMDEKTGGLMGMTDKSTITFSSFDGDVFGESSTKGMRVGGLIGVGIFTSVTDSHSSGKVKGENNWVGGVVGDSQDDSKFLRCFSTARVTGYQQVGGFAGQVTYNSYIKDCYTTGRIQADDYQGGFVGMVTYESIIENCYSTGEIINYPSFYSGGFAGRNTHEITNCYWDTGTSKKDESSGGTGTDTTHMQTQELYEPEWDFETVWELSNEPESPSYPYLRTNEQIPPPQ